MTGSTNPGDGGAFGEYLLRTRRALGMSQAELARTSGMSERALRDLERGRAAAPQERSAELLAAALALTGSRRESFLLLARECRRRSVRRIVLHGLPAVGEPVGREAELRRVSDGVEPGGVLVVTGPPGIGKTSVAVAAAQRIAARFPDGHLALDLRGVDDCPMSSHTALEWMLNAVGVPADRVPPDLDDRSTLLSTLLRDLRVLVVLDNALNEAQIRPLLSRGRRSSTIVTCRSALAGLESATWLTLDVLPSPDAVELIRAVVGEQAVREEPEAVDELVALCGNLPLALRIVCNLLATRRRWSIATAVARLRDERSRLDSLSAGDLQLRSVFEVSYRRLEPPARAVFRRLALLPASSFDEALAAVAADMSPDRVSVCLDELVEASLLVTGADPVHFRFHDLVRLFAADRLASDEAPDVRERLRYRVLARLRP
ncbi:NB-ARC domain-containing protein [Lentzea sp. NPDC055074]